MPAAHVCQQHVTQHKPDLEDAVSERVHHAVHRQRLPDVPGILDDRRGAHGEDLHDGGAARPGGKVGGKKPAGQALLPTAASGSTWVLRRNQGRALLMPRTRLPAQQPHLAHHVELHQLVNLLRPAQLAQHLRARRALGGSAGMNCRRPRCYRCFALRHMCGKCSTAPHLDVLVPRVADVLDPQVDLPVDGQAATVSCMMSQACQHGAAHNRHCCCKAGALH